MLFFKVNQLNYALICGSSECGSERQMMEQAYLRLAELL